MAVAKAFTPQDIYLQQLGLKPMTLGLYRFWINPQHFSMVTQRIMNEVPTKTGVGRFSWGLQAVKYTFTGFTGNGGLGALSDPAVGMQSFRPWFGAQDLPVALIFPARGLKRTAVYVDYFEDSMDSSMPNYFSYEIHCSEYPLAPPPFYVQSNPQGGTFAGVPSAPFDPSKPFP